MRHPFVAGLLLSVAAAGLVVTAQDRPLPDDPLPFGPPPGWPARHAAIQVPAASGDAPNSEASPLPLPSIKEPFSIGEALHDPARVGDAIVSVLPLMGIEVIPDDPELVVFGGPRFQLQQSEVRALIDIGRADAEAQATDPSHTFSDLHKRVERLLPGISVEALAAGYSEEFERNPDSVVAQVLMGQPLGEATSVWYLTITRRKANP